MSRLWLGYGSVMARLWLGAISYQSSAFSHQYIIKRRSHGSIHHFSCAHFASISPGEHLATITYVTVPYRACTLGDQINILFFQFKILKSLIRFYWINTQIRVVIKWKVVGVYTTSGRLH